MNLDGVTARCVPGEEVRLKYVRVTQDSVVARGSWAAHACTHAINSGTAKHRLEWHATASVGHRKLHPGSALAEGESIVLRDGTVLAVLPWQQQITLT